MGVEIANGFVGFCEEFVEVEKKLGVEMGNWDVGYLGFCGEFDEDEKRLRD